MHVDSWQDPGGYESDGTPDFAGPGWVSAQAPTYPEGLTGCDLLQFDPSLTLLPEAEHTQADEPAGYDADLEVPQTSGSQPPGDPGTTEGDADISGRRRDLRPLRLPAWRPVRPKVLKVSNWGARIRAGVQALPPSAKPKR